MEEYTVMFADVAGSTSLYEKLGDVAAEQQISSVVDFMIALVNAHNGIVIKTIGDEVMCRFSSPSDALKTAVEVQCGMRTRQLSSQTALKVRIGMQHGPAILKEEDLFGDTVNVAARMAGLALADQIITTLECVDNDLNSLKFPYRKIDTLLVKGRERPVDVCEVLWRSDDSELTALMSQVHVQEKLGSVPRVHIRAMDSVYALSDSDDALVIGRNDQCDIVVTATTASRIHAKLICRRGKVFLVDQSTNGTFVRLDNGEELFVHREEISLTHSGIISLGVSFEDFVPGDEHHCVDGSLLAFSCEGEKRSA